MLRRVVNLMGEALRLQVSSQSLKRAWRTSELFQQKFIGSLGVRTKELGTGIYEDLLNGGVPQKRALEWSRAMAGRFGKIKKEKDPHPTEIEQLCFVTPEKNQSVRLLTKKPPFAGIALTMPPGVKLGFMNS